MSTPATRLITLIMLLQRQPNQKAADLADKLGISIRTLHRYFGMLEEMGIPIYAERGPQGGFSLVRGYKLPPLIFTPNEAVAIYLGSSLVGQIWGQLYLGAAQGAMAKLDNVLPDEQREELGWARRSLVATRMQRADPSTLAPQLEIIRRSTRLHRQIKMTYQSSNDPDPTERIVDPYSLVFRSGWWYLVGYCHLREALRTFRVDRVKLVELLGKPYRVPEGFDIHAYLKRTFADQPGVQARLRFVPEAVHIAKANLPGWESSEEHPDGSLDVIVSAPDLNWLASLVLSFGTWVTVCEPLELKHLVRDWALGTAALYQEKKHQGKKRSGNEA